MSLPSEGQSLQQTKFRRDISIGGWDITISGFEIETSAMLEFYFRFRSRPFRRNRRIILHQPAEFRPNRNICRWNMTSYPFLKIAAAVAQYYFRFCISWCPCRRKVKIYQQTKFRRHQWSTYINLWLRYNDFWFAKTNVHHIGILLPVPILTISS